MAGIDNDVFYGKNCDYTGVAPPQESNGLVTNGQLWIGTTAVNAGGTHINVNTLTAGTGVTITNGPGTITIGLTGGGAAVEHLTADSGGQLNPDGSNNFNLLGSGSITTIGLGSTITTQLTGLTNHAVLVGAGTTTITKVGPTATSGQILQSAGAAADPAFSTATYPATTTINQILYSSSANVVSGLATANRGVLTTGATGIPVITALATDGQLIIGSTAGAPAAATLTAGTGISITNGSNSISIAVTGGAAVNSITGGPGITITGTAAIPIVNSVIFTDTTATTLAVDNGYFATAAGTYNMPATALQGEVIEIVCDTTGAVVLDCPANNFIRIGSLITSSGGTSTSTLQGDSLKLRYRVSSLTWEAISVIGTWIIA